MKDGRLFSEYRIRDAIVRRRRRGRHRPEEPLDARPGPAPGHLLRARARARRARARTRTRRSPSASSTPPTRSGRARRASSCATATTSGIAALAPSASPPRSTTTGPRSCATPTRSRATRHDDGEHTIERLQAGVAYRDSETNKWNALARVEHRLEDDDTQPGIELKQLDARSSPCTPTGSRSARSS